MAINFKQQHTNKVLSYSIQAGLLFFLLSFFVLILILALANLSVNLEMHGLSHGFGFLKNTAGFDLLFSLVDVEASDSYVTMFFASLDNTFFLCVVVLTVALPMGVITSILYLYCSSSLKAALKNTLSCVESLPLLIILFVLYHLYSYLPSHPDTESGLLGIGLLNVRGWHLPDITAGLSGIYSACLFLTAFMVVCLFTAPLNRGKSILTMLLIYIIAIVASILFFQAWPMPVIEKFRVVNSLTIPPEFIVLAFLLIIHVTCLIAKSLIIGIETALQANPHIDRQSFAHYVKGVVFSSGSVITNIMSTLKYSTLGTFISFPDFFNVMLGTALNQTGAVYQLLLIGVVIYSGIYLFFNGLGSLVDHFVVKKQLLDIPKVKALKNNFLSWLLPVFIVFSIGFSFGIWFLSAALWWPDLSISNVLGFTGNTSLSALVITGALCLFAFFWNKHTHTTLYPIIALVLIFLLFPSLGGFIDISENVQGLALNWSLALSTLALSLPVGITLGAGAASNWLCVAIFCKSLIAFFRSIPVLILLFASSVLLPLLVSPDVEVYRTTRLFWFCVTYSAVMIASCFSIEYRSVIGNRKWSMTDAKGEDIISHYYGGFAKAIHNAKPAFIHIVVRLLLLTSLFNILGTRELMTVIGPLSWEANMIENALSLYFTALLSLGLPAIAFTLYANYLESRQEQSQGIALRRRKAISHFL